MKAPSVELCLGAWFGLRGHLCATRKIWCLSKEVPEAHGWVTISALEEVPERCPEFGLQFVFFFFLIFSNLILFFYFSHKALG